MKCSYVHGHAEYGQAFLEVTNLNTSEGEIVQHMGALKMQDEDKTMADKIVGQDIAGLDIDGQEKYPT